MRKQCQHHRLSGIECPNPSVAWIPSDPGDNCCDQPAPCEHMRLYLCADHYDECRRVFGRNWRSEWDEGHY